MDAVRVFENVTFALETWREDPSDLRVAEALEGALAALGTPEA